MHQVWGFFTLLGDLAYCAPLTGGAFYSAKMWWAIAPPPPFIEAPDIKFMQAQENLFIQSSNKDLNVLQNLNCLSYMIPVFNHHFTDVSDLGYDLNTIWNWLWLYINVIVQILPQQQFGIFEKIQILPRNEDFNQSLTQKIT